MRRSKFESGVWSRILVIALTATPLLLDASAAQSSPPVPPRPMIPLPAPPNPADFVLTARLARDPLLGRDFTTDRALNEAPSNGWVSYVLNLTNTKGMNITAIDTTLEGVFHQRWQIFQEEDPAGNPIDVLVKTPVNDGITNGDSHFLPPAGEAVSIILDENNNFYVDPAPAPDTAQRDYGIGTYLRGIYGIPNAQLSPSVDFAYVVIPRGGESGLSLRLQFGLPDGLGYELRETSMVYVPEPATASLVGLALAFAAGAAPRRRPRLRQSPEVAA
jgi:hypothetical protein